MGLGDEMVPRVGDERGPGVRNQGDGVPGQQSGNDRRRFRPFVVLVKARRPRRDGVVLKETRGPAGVFRRDQGDFAQDAEGP